MTQYGMAIDLKRCFGCQSCSAACKMINNMPKDASFNVVYTKDDTDYSHPGKAVAKGDMFYGNAGGEFPNAILSYFPVNCQHCSTPSCVAVCPTGASQKDPETGIVTIDYDVCIGCQSCMSACPYNVRVAMGENPESWLDIVTGEYDAPPHKANTVEKCTFCKNLIDRGEAPACMDLCPGHARYWGDLDDPESNVSKAIAGRETLKYLEDAGTKPNVFYLL
ncbi:4Fe-4S dicluster domain-containing protein [Slackia heliotrinireducens]|uniref:4Fe-4S dicluster domain-containing protein n=1 Tax=Slackia heliotrinireducens TaxID=84110 RepID=UPI00331562B2